MNDLQKVPHNFVWCEQTGEPCFWWSCLAHDCAAKTQKTAEPLAEPGGKV
jgi:hypothetical protein